MSRPERTWIKPLCQKARSRQAFSKKLKELQDGEYFEPTDKTLADKAAWGGGGMFVVS